MFDTAIFDLDGTLLNTLTDLADACNYALGKMGLPLYPENQYKRFVGNGVGMLISRMLGDSETQKNHQLALDYFNEYYNRHSTDNTAPYPGVYELLKSLNEKGIKCCVVSNKPHEYTQALCRQYFGDSVQMAFGNHPPFKTKPDPALALYAAKEIGAKSVIYIGDSDVDMQTAKNAGFYACGVLWGFREKDELLKNGADVTCTDTQLLLHIILNEKQSL